MSVPASPNLTVPLVPSGVQSDYFIKTKFLGEISIEKCVAFGPYCMDGQLSGADKILLARTLHHIPPGMSMEESLHIAVIVLFLLPFMFIHSV
jgi:hypothetical protein